MKNRYLSLFLKYGLALLILGWVVWSHWDVKQDGQQVGLSVVLERPLHGWFLAVGIAICSVAMGLTLVRWYYLVIAQGLPFTLRDAVRLGLVGFFFNTFLPGSVGGDLIKAAFIAREQSRRTLAVATVLLDRVIGLAGLFWLATILGGGLFLSGAFDSQLAEPKVRWSIQALLLFACGIVAGTIAFWLLLGFLPTAWLDRMQEKLRGIPKVGHPLAELVQAVRIYRQKGRFVGLALGLSMIGHFGFVLTFYCGSRFFSPAEQLPPLSVHLLLVPVGMTIQAGIPLPGGIGGAELGYGKLYEWTGFSFADGVLGSLGFRMILWILGMVGLGVYLNMRKTLEAVAAPRPGQVTKEGSEPRIEHS